MKTCIIIEDSPPAQRILKKYISDAGNIELKAAFTDAIQAMAFLKEHSVDFIFLDIHLPKLSGMEFLKTVSPCPPIILTTAFQEYALQSYEYDVVDYLLKPFSFDRFLKAINKLPDESIKKADTSAEKSDLLFIKSAHEYIMINTSDIKYIKADGDYTKIYLNQTRHIVNQPLKFWKEKLDPINYLQIHKSYIISLKDIQKIAGNQVYISDETIPIGRSYKEILQHKIQSLLI